jgi:ATP-dependent DNA helicase RecG
MKPVINRIVIGDVGSGKTITAFLIALGYIHSLLNGRATLLVPTEVLAYQHYTQLLELTRNSTLGWLKNLDIIYSTSKLNQVNGEKVTKKQLDTYITATTPAVFVGTHSLLFKEGLNSDIILIDEQHRFGVAQRKHLSEKSKYSPHFISFSATPIPRTLALTVYKSLTPHFIETLAMRKSIQTQIFSFDRIAEMKAKIQDRIVNGQKVYIICSKVEESDGDDEQPGSIWSIAKATDFFEKQFSGKVRHVHGKKADKKDILQEFKQSPNAHILVATTVVEVGVDVSEATLMIILNAERFGLSALHQIRGRIGRNNYTNNECLLVTDKQFLRNKRLQYLTQLNNGFDIAEKDLELRGAGDMIGVHQSGFSDEIQELIGLSPESYKQLDDIINQIDFSRINIDLPRLNRYILQQSESIWKE